MYPYVEMAEHHVTISRDWIVFDSLVRVLGVSYVFVIINYSMFITNKHRGIKTTLTT